MAPASAFNRCYLGICLCILLISVRLPVVHPSHIPKTWIDFIQSCIAAFKSSGEKQCFSGIFHSSGGKHVDGNTETFIIPPVILWNPLVHQACDLACPYCRSSLREWRWNDGTSSHTMPRSIFSIQERVLLVSCVYLCVNNHHQVIAHDPELLKAVRNSGIRIPFVLFHKSGMTKELLDFISSSIHAGMCIQDIEAMLLNLHNSHHCSRAFQYYSQYSSSGSVQAHVPLFQPRKDFIGRMLITRAFLRVFSECEDMFTQHMASQHGKWLSADHTFKISANIGYWKDKQWIKLYNSVFIVMNEKNKVLGWQLTRGTSIDTVQSLLYGLKQRHVMAQAELEGFIIDNCCIVKNKIHAIFGSSLPIKLDLFHGLKRILDKIPRKGVTADLRQVRQVMIKDLRLCFRQVNDLGQTRKKNTPAPDQMEKNLHDFLNKWSAELINDVRVLSDKAINEINKLLKHVKSGCLSDIPPGVGTNRNENIHKMLRKWLKKDRIGVALAVALLSTVFYKLNASEMDKTGRERKICPSVSQWFHAFLTANKDWSSEKFGIGQNLPSLSAVMDENESLHLLSDNLDIGFSEDDVTSGESDSDDCGHDENLTLQSEEGIVKRAHAMANIASNNFKKEQSPLFANKHFWIHAPSMLLLFSHTDYNGQGEYSDSVNKLDEIVRNNGFERMSVPGDGDCCFSSISHGLDNMLAVGDEAVSQHLQSLNIHKHQELSERNIILRELVVAEWLGENSEKFAAFLTTSEKSSFEDTAQTFLQQGIFDCELGNSVLLALCNVLKIPIVVFSSIESYPVIPLLPRESPLTFVPIYVAFNQSGKGHYDPVFATNDLPAPAYDSQNSESADTGNVKIQSCCCGRGGAKDKNRSFCSTYGSRCKCFQQLQGCNPSCKCFNCGNPHGQRMGKKERQVRKRRRHDDSPLSSVAYMERKNEPLAPERLEDFELFVLQQIVSATITQSNEDATPDYDGIFKLFKQVLISAGFNNIPPCEKVKRLVDWIIRERSLFSLMLRQEVKKSWYSA